MSEKKQTDHQQHEEPTTESAKQNYLFPNGGDIPAFSCRAVSQEEAEELNEHHMKQQKETK